MIGAPSTIISNTTSLSLLQTCLRLPPYNGYYQNPPYTAYSELEFNGNIAVPDEQGDYDPADHNTPTNNQTLPPRLYEPSCIGNPPLRWTAAPDTPLTIVLLPPPTAFLTKRANFGRKHLLFHLALTPVSPLPLPPTASSHLDLIPHIGTPLFFPPTNQVSPPRNRRLLYP